MYRLKYNDTTTLPVHRSSLIIPLLHLLCTMHPPKDFGDFPVYDKATNEQVRILADEKYRYTHTDYAEAMLMLAAQMGQEVFVYDDCDEVKVYGSREALNTYIEPVHGCTYTGDNQLRYIDDNELFEGDVFIRELGILF